MHYLYIMPVFYVFTFVHCTAFYSPATEALINNNNNYYYLDLKKKLIFFHTFQPATNYLSSGWISQNPWNKK